MRNLPNLLSLARIALIVPVLICAQIGGARWSLVATALFVLAAMTDWLDGYLARRFHAQSALGQTLDTLADKLMVASVIIWLTSQNKVSFWLSIAVIARELIVSSMRVHASAQGASMPVNWWGKWKLFLQTIALFLLLISSVRSAWMIACERLGTWALVVSIALGLISAVMYAMQMHSANRTKN
jgi:CDP-diacylglycerol--glycerol-3-phosphate 3-phosphatidyltransferase